VLKAIAGIMTALFMIPLVLLLVWWIWTEVASNNAAKKAQIQAGRAEVAAGQAQASAAAQRIVIAGQAREHLDLTVHQENAHAIAQAPGADAPLDPGLVRVANVGLCRHPAFAADPGCAGLRGPDPGQLPDPGGGARPLGAH
jgi:hypothetical protein